MNIWTNLSFRNKFIVSFGIISVLLFSLSVLTFVFSKSIQSNVEYKYALLVKDMKLQVVQVQQWLTDISATRAAEGYADGFDEAKAQADGFKENVTQLRNLYETRNDTAMLQKIRELETSFESYYECGKVMAQKYIDEGPAGGNVMMDDFDAYASDINERFDEVVLIIKEELDRNMKSIISSSQLLSTLVAIGAFAIFVICVGIGYLLNRSITLPVSLCVSNIQKVSDGELTDKIQLHQKDEMGKMANAIDQMKLQLSKLILSARTSSEQVASSSEELSASAQNLANSATEQASGLEQISTSLETLSQSIEANLENADKTQRISESATQNAVTGSEAVIATVEAMKSIAQKISIINDIADQTNLLALNAAIEAARAGDAGKGFAVVAVEVRKLAERSQQAAKEISSLAGTSVDRAETAGKLIEEIVPNIQEVSQLMKDISLSCSEQSQGAKQVVEAVGQMDTVTQQNSANSEEIAASSEELSAQAQMLQEMVARFRIEENHSVDRVQVKDVVPNSKQDHQLLPKQDENDKKDEFAYREEEYIR